MTYPKLDIGTRVKTTRGSESDLLNGTIVDYKPETAYVFDSNLITNIYTIQWDELRNHDDKGLRDWPEKDLYNELKILTFFEEDLFNV